MEQKNKKLDLPFDGPYKTKPSAVPGKHGIGFSTARHLARQGMAQQVKKAKTNEDNEQGVAEARVGQLPTKGADYSEHDTDHLKIMLRPGILHRNESGFKALIRKELKKREQQNQQGIAQQVKKTKTNEDNEQDVAEETLSELKKSTLGSYAKKAKDEMGLSAMAAGAQGARGERIGRAIDMAHAKRRSKGLDKAITRLAKEEVEPIDELNKDTLSFKNFRDQIAEKHLTPAEMKKREEIAKAIHKENPGMPMGNKMAIATASAKKAA